MQARFLIPMAISLGFGILFGTVIILILVPAVYLIVENLLRRDQPALADSLASPEHPEAGPVLNALLLTQLRQHVKAASCRITLR